jgi:hypothetical protein
MRRKTLLFTNLAQRLLHKEKEPTVGYRGLDDWIDEIVRVTSLPWRYIVSFKERARQIRFESNFREDVRFFWIFSGVALAIDWHTSS